MKKLFLLYIAVSLCSVSFAKNRTKTTACPVASCTENTWSSVGARTTAVGDTSFLTNIPSGDTLTIYKYDSGYGYVTGPNSNGDIGFAERYDINGADSSVTVLGVMAQFSGKVNPLSSKSVNFMVWDITAPTAIDSSLGYSGFPRSGLDTVNVPVTRLGIGTTKDTLKAFLFPTAHLFNVSFFAGYTVSYDYTNLNGDTLGLASSKNGSSIKPHLTIITVPPVDSGANTYDTLMNVQNATMWSDFSWHDNYTDNDSLYNNLAIFPIVAIGAPTSVAAITRNNLSLYGNYPNPACNETNIKFAVSQSAAVTIQITDMTGKVLDEVSDQSKSTGVHIMTVNTSQLAAGNYLYIIHTSTGDAIAGKMTIAR